MRILYLNNTMILGGGVQKCIYMLSKEFIGKHKVFVASAGGEYEAELEELGVVHKRIINPEKKNIFSILKNLFLIYKLVKNDSIDLIHSHHRMTTVYAKIIACFTKVKVVHSAHLYTEDKIKLTNFALKNIPVISVSNGVGEGLSEVYNLKKENITTIYNTVEFSQIKAEVKKEILDAKKNGSFVVASISRLEPVKGLENLLIAAKSIINLQLDVKFILIGEGSEREKYLDFIKSNNMENDVFVLGKVPNVKDYLKYIDVLIQCSYREGFGLAVAEAAAVGVPSIASNIHGLNEVIIENYNGLLIEPGNSKELEAAILKLYEDQNLLSFFGENGKNHYEKNFSKKQYYDGHESFYEKLIR
ncbi:glycosyltransferase family 4 protein [Bacillales bacterium AN1005]|uniref:glycosyltransferase family 4 protein n=1 Tax=Niallia taxi TaxID=2499688 RepID=UPI0021A96106|nr:glycosyltransferase family 4 protein [Niallia taxi]MCT2347466.1 glycosyltransferase family 4 protein [Niallia taxi]